MENYVNEKVIIVTGAGSGFGKLDSEILASMGGEIICADINENNLKAVVDGIKEKGGKAEYIVTDVTNRDQVNNMAKFAIDTYGAIDVLINNAGIMPLSFFNQHDIAWKAWDRCIDINFKGIVYGMSAVYDQMIKQGHGHIVNISSIFGNAPVVGSAVYTATKAAARYLTEAFRQENQGVIKTTIIRPTGINGTNLASEVLDLEAMKGLCACNYSKWQEHVQQFEGGSFDPEMTNINSTKYWTIEPSSLSEAVVYCINQPWGIELSDLTVRATGEDYMI